MSGGHFNYVNDSLCDEVTGVYPDYDLSGEDHAERAKASSTLNKLEDKEISEIVYDIFCILHSYDWYRSGDTGRDDYEKDVKAFKEKWIKKKDSTHARCTGEADMFINKIRDFSDQAICYAYLCAYSFEKYGVVDAQKEWITVTQQKAALDRAYTQGRMDEAARWCGKDVD